ncbi:MAG: formylglycine-generating enzyme family protein [Steroidobacteraceae bacterium]
MSAEIADRLRALARDHLEGRTGLQSYRRLRARLLDDLVAPGTGGSADATQPRAAAQLAEVTQPRAAAPRAAAEASVTRSPEGEPRSGRLAGYAALALVLAFAVALLLWRHHSRSLPSAPEAAAPGGGQTDPIQALLEPLLQNPDWSDARLLALNEALLEAGRPRLEAVRSTDWFDAFVASVRSRLLQQQALAGVPLTPDNSPLAALAVTLGIDLAAASRPVSSDTQVEGEPRAHLPRDGDAQGKRVPRAAGSERRAGSAGSKGNTGAAGSARSKSESTRTRSARDLLEQAELASTGPAGTSSRAAETPGPAAAQPASLPAARPESAPARRSMRFNANAWHLLHMVGNAREWVEDAWNPTFAGAPTDGSARLQGEAGIKVVRGGCYSDQAIALRLTTREPLPADTRDRCTGIRLVREVSP